MESEYLYKGIAVYCFAVIVLILAFILTLIAIGTFITVLLILFLLYVAIPIVFKYTPSLQKALLYLSSVYIPVDFKQPNKFIPGSRNLYIKTKNDSISLGVWQILPKSLLLNATLFTPLEQYDRWLSHGEPVFIYMHGNSGNRGTGHRIDLYKVLQNNNYHVIAFDYRMMSGGSADGETIAEIVEKTKLLVVQHRTGTALFPIQDEHVNSAFGYGDSGQGELSEDGTVNDAMAIYEWTKEKVKGQAKIFFWGHSLGTGISSHLLHVLESKNESVTGLVLEAPFNNLKEEIKSYPLAQIWTFLPWFDYFFTSPMYDNGLRYESDEHLTHIKAPILILHAEDDMVIPIKLSKKLYERILSSRDGSTVEFKTYPSNRHYGHKFIVKDKNLPIVLDEFVRKSTNALKRS